VRHGSAERQRPRRELHQHNMSLLSRPQWQSRERTKRERSPRLHAYLSFSMCRCWTRSMVTAFRGHLTPVRELAKDMRATPSPGRETIDHKRLSSGRRRKWAMRWVHFAASWVRRSNTQGGQALQQCPQAIQSPLLHLSEAILFQCHNCITRSTSPVRLYIRVFMDQYSCRGYDDVHRLLQGIADTCPTVARHTSFQCRALIMAVSYF
jgi:hypothetical protein